MSLALRFNWIFAPAAGALGTLSFAPFEYWPFATLSLILWMWLTIQSPRFLTGFLFGLGLFGSGVSWISVSMMDHGGTSWPLALLMTSIFVAGLATFPGLASLFFGSLRRRWQGPVGEIMLLTASWVTTEVLRSWFLTGFPWLLIGYSALDSPFEGYLSWFGAFGVTALIALTAGGIVAGLRSGRWQPALLSIFIPLFGIFLDSQFTPKTFAQGTKVGLWQPVIDQSKKWKIEHQKEIIATHMTQGLPSPDVQLIIWPETALPMTESDVYKVLPDLDTHLTASKQTLITGALGKEAGRYTNRLIALGLGNGTYDKTRLVPFGEYVPLEALFRGLITFFDLPMSTIVRGSRRGLLTHNELEIAPLICYEIAYTKLARSQSSEANLILTVSNDTWFGTSIGPSQHLQIARIRARELGKPVIRATNDGLTAFIDARGKITEQLPRFQRGLLIANVFPANTVTPYSKAGEGPLIILLIIILALTRKNTATLHQ
jgi:apolipoprotein N-acyltransferase